MSNYSNSVEMFQSELCRLCGTVKTCTLSLFGEKSLKLNTLMKINLLFKDVLAVSKYDKYSKCICSDCESAVFNFFEFWEMVTTVQKNIPYIQQNTKINSTPVTNAAEGNDSDLGLNLCHTTGITNDSETVLILINAEKQIQCDVCKASLHISQLLTLYLVTHGLGTVLCQCQQCGHKDDIGTFLQEKNNNVQCPNCLFRKSSHFASGYNKPLDNSSFTEVPNEPCTTIKHEHENDFSTEQHKSTPMKYENIIDNECQVNENISKTCDYNQTLSSCQKCKNINDNSYYNTKNELNKNSNSNTNENISNETYTTNCDNTTRSDIKLSNNNKTIKTHQCNVCQQVFNHKGHLSRHLLIHKNLKPYLCDICGSKFNQKSTLKTHYSHVHNSENEYKCVWCGQAFKHKMNLESHLLNNHNMNGVLKTKFYCNTCDKYFITKSKLQIHSRMHTSEKPYQCNVCNKSFTQKNNLTVHLKKYEMGCNNVVTS